MAGMVVGAAIVATVAALGGYAIGKGKSEEEIKQLNAEIAELRKIAKALNNKITLTEKEQIEERQTVKLLKEAIEEGNIGAIQFLIKQHTQQVAEHTK